MTPTATTTEVDIWTPTLQLQWGMRWINQFSHPSPVGPFTHYNSGPQTTYVLQQLWVCGEKRQWRDIPVAAANGWGVAI